WLRSCDARRNRLVASWLTRPPLPASLGTAGRPSTPEPLSCGAVPAWRRQPSTAGRLVGAPRGRGGMERAARSATVPAVSAGRLWVLDGFRRTWLEERRECRRRPPTHKRS